MLLMVIETFRSESVPAIARRFKDNGRMLPDGITYHASWMQLGGRRSFQVMEAPGRASLDIWINRCNDLVDFEIHPVLTSTEYWGGQPNPT